MAGEDQHWSLGGTVGWWRHSWQVLTSATDTSLQWLPGSLSPRKWEGRGWACPRSRGGRSHGCAASAVWSQGFHQPSSTCPQALTKVHLSDQPWHHGL